MILKKILMAKLATKITDQHELKEMEIWIDILIRESCDRCKMCELCDTCKRCEPGHREMVLTGPGYSGKSSLRILQIIHQECYTVST